jgi:hypothetical protein
MFVFADGRRCQMPPSADDMDLCYFHAKKHQDHLNAQQAGQEINEFLGRDILTACDLSAALATLFSATSLGLIKPKTTAALTYLGNLMLQTQKLAKQEFLETFDDRWPKIVRESIVFNEPASEPETPATPSPGPTNPTTTHPIPFPKQM